MKNFLCLCLCLFFALPLMQAQSIKKLNSQNIQLEKAQQFANENNAKISIDEITKLPEFIHIPKENALKLSGASLQEKTGDFLDKNAELYNLKEWEQELIYATEKTDKHGFKHVKMEQKFHGVPVFDGQLNFHYNSNDELVNVNGNYLPYINLDHNPAIPSSLASQIALAEISRQNNADFPAPIKVNKNNLYVFNDGIVKGTRGQTYLAYEIEVRNDLNIREFLYVDAQTGAIVEQYTGICNALYRRLYEVNIGNEVWNEGDLPTLPATQAQQNEVITAGHSYHMYNNTFSYDSYDNNGAEMRTINNNQDIQCPNATWNGTTTNYCDGVTADDVVAHEWAHAYTEYTCNLIYAWQSGALNESLSDIWGETVDLLNNYEDAGEDNSVRNGTGCSESNRWKIGEDVTATGIPSPLRDMWVPGCSGHPGSVTDANYHCQETDNGGVHINSGVPNHFYSLIVDGGTFNNQPITALGFTKAAHIVWRAQSQYLTSTSDFADFAAAVRASCADLEGINLQGLSFTSTPAGLSGEIITAADCAEVEKAILATELETPPTQCGFTTLLAPAPALCDGASAANAIFYEDWESGLPGNWTLTNIGGSGTWTPRDWVLATTLPGARAGQAVFGVDPLDGDCQGDDEHGLIRLQSPTISVPGSAVGPILMAFDHYVAMESSQGSNWDAGNLKYSVNGGTWTVMPDAAFTANPHNGVVANSGNPLAGERAFAGTDEGSNSGSWGQSQVDLSSILSPGQNIQFRWEVGTDECNGVVGWYVDEVRVYSCTVAPATFTLTPTNSPQTVCQGTNASFNIDLAFQGATSTVNFSATAGVPAGASATFSPTSLSADGTTTMTVTTAGVAPGTYNITVQGEDNTDTETTTVTLNVGGIVGQVTLSAPANGATGVSPSANLTWNADVNATGYDVEVATDAGFGASVVFSQSGVSGNSVTATGLSINTQYFWRVRAVSGCGNGAWSPVWNFTTQDVTPCTDFAGGPYIDFNPIPSACFNDCTPVTQTFNVWQSEGYIFYNMAAGEEYTFEFCNGYDPVANWEALITVAQYDVTGPTIGTVIGVASGCSLTFTAPSNGDYIATITNLNDCGGPEVQTDNGLPTLTCSGLTACCDALFTDPGGVNSLYPNDGNATYTICPDSPTQTVEVNFSSFSLEDNVNGGCWDQLSAYEGTSAAGIPIADYCDAPGSTPPTIVTAPNAGDCLTFVFTSDGTINQDGWVATVNCLGGLPIELTNFQANKDKETALLTWQTASEQSNKGFHIEHSTDGKNFEQIGWKDGAGTTSSTESYQFTDATPFTGLNYYRLLQVNFDGTSEYSDIKTVLFKTDFDITLFPNPTKVGQNTTLQLSAQKAQDINVVVYDATGKHVLTLASSIEAGINTLNLSHDKLSNGVYFVSVTYDGGTENIKLSVID